MSCFVITEHDHSELSSPVFSAGRDDHEEAAVAFTTRSAAKQYIRDAGWEQTDVVGEIDSTATLHWLLHLHGEGVEFLAVDPVRESQESGHSQPMINIRGLVDEFSEILRRRIESPAPVPTDDLVARDVFTCQQCGRVLKRPQGEPAPLCHEQKMALAARDSIHLSEPATPRSSSGRRIDAATGRV